MKYRQVVAIYLKPDDRKGVKRQKLRRFVLNTSEVETLLKLLKEFNEERFVLGDYMRPAGPLDQIADSKSPYSQDVDWKCPKEGRFSSSQITDAA